MGESAELGFHSCTAGRSSGPLWLHHGHLLSQHQLGHSNSSSGDSGTLRPPCDGTAPLGNESQPGADSIPLHTTPATLWFALPLDKFFPLPLRVALFSQP